MIKYTLKLIFPEDPNKRVVTNLDYQVTSKPMTLPQLRLPVNTMPEKLYPGDTLKFTYDKESVKIMSCIYTLYPLRGTSEQKKYTKDGKEQITDFVELFDKPIEITPTFKGTWIFHLLGMYKRCGKRYSFYLDPEASCG